MVQAILSNPALQLLKPGRVAGEVRRDQDRLPDLVGRHVLGEPVELLRRLDVPAGGEEHVGAPLLVRDPQGLFLGARPREVDLQDEPLASPPLERNAAIISSSLARGWLTVASPSAHSPARPAVSTLTAGPIRGGG